MTDQTIAAAAPKKAPKVYPARVCHDCGEAFAPESYQQQFCSTAHKAAFQNRLAVEGRAVVALLKAWRAARNKKENGPFGAQCLSEVSSILDSFNAADREAGRPSPLVYAKALMEGGRDVDRQAR